MVGISETPGIQVLENITQHREYVEALLKYPKDVHEKVKAEKLEQERLFQETEAVKSQNEAVLNNIKLATAESEKASRQAKIDREEANNARNEADRKIKQARELEAEVKAAQEKLFADTESKNAALTARENSINESFTQRNKICEEREEKSKVFFAKGEEFKAEWEAKIRGFQDLANKKQTV